MRRRLIALIIDIFSHIFPHDYLKILGQVETPYVVKIVESNKYYFRAWRTYTFDCDSHWTDPRFRVKVMDEYGVDFQVLMLGAPNTHKCGKYSKQLAVTSNDAISRIVQEYPERFLGVAEIPLHDIDEALEELERATQELGLRGVQLLSNADELWIDSPSFLPIFAAIDSLGLPIWLHPAPRESIHSYYNQYGLDLSFMWPFETSITAVRLILSGLLDRFPSLKFIVHHLGALIPFFYARLSSNVDVLLSSGDLRLSKRLDEYFKSFYFDTAIHQAASVECAYKVFGDDRICFGSDFPYGPDGGYAYLREGMACVRQATIPEDSKRKILGENASRLLKL